MAILTPAQLWENYDRYKPSEPTYLKENDFSFKVYFNGESIGSQTVRIYAHLTLPQNTTKKPPVLLLLHDASRNVNEVTIQPLLDYGYAVLIVDYLGSPANAHYTRYPRSILNEVTLESALNPSQNPKATAWYHWTAVALHSVTFLENCEYVDGQNIGIFGVNEGASITFKASNLVELKAGMTFFCGESKDALKDNLSYMASLDSRAYGKNNFPILINGSTNEKNGGLDYLNELYQGLENTAYFSVLPRADRCVGKGQRNNIGIWFNNYFGVDQTPFKEFKKPVLTTSFSEDKLYAELNCKAKKVSFYSATDSKPELRSWNEISHLKLGEEKYIAKIDVFSPKPILIFARVETEEGLTLSTPVVIKAPKQISEAKKSRLIYNADMGIDVFMHENSRFFEDKWVEIKEGPLGLSGVAGDQLTTYKPSEERFGGDFESLLQVMLYSDSTQDVEFRIMLKDCDNEEFSCTKRLVGGEWTTITLSKNDFKSVRCCPSFEKTVCLSIVGKNIMVNSILWV